MLFSEIATLISGQYVQIEMLPLSFKEYMESTESMADRGVKYTEQQRNTILSGCLSVRDEKTSERELRPLMAIRDHYPKMILTLDDDPEAQYDGIRRINARDWLLGLTEVRE